MLKSIVITLMVAGMNPIFGAEETAPLLIFQNEINSEVMSKSVTKKKQIHPLEFGNTFLKGDFASIYNQTSDEFKEAVTFEQFQILAESFNHGVEEYNLETSLPINKHMKQYILLDGERTKGISVIFDRNYTIQVLNLAPLVSYPESDQQFTKNEYIMPIKEKWFVVWGGTNQLTNYHYVADTQRYAYDLVIMKNEQTYYGNPNKNNHYYAFGKEVAAPVDGRIVQVMDGIKDNVPGEMNSSQPAGNHVVIEHENGEYSMLAHFKQDSIVVEEGDYVKKGEVIGLCGNSGNSSEPHIHFQVMDSPDFLGGKSIRIQFKDGSDPIKGDFVLPAL